MNKRARRWGVLTVAVAVSLFAAACGDDSGSSSATTAAGGASTSGAATSGASTTGAVEVSGTLQGSGSSFSLAFLQEAATNFNDANPGLRSRTAAAARAKAAPTSPRRRSTTPDPTRPTRMRTSRPSPSSTSRSCSGLSPCRSMCPASTACNLSPDTIAGIFQRDITTWNDPAIAADNPDASLPDTAITVAHRSDGSGTTQNFTEWLVVASPDVWTLKSGSTVEWPADTQAGNGNQGVAQIVQSTDGAIGYVDLSDAVAAGLNFAVGQEPGRRLHPTDLRGGVGRWRRCRSCSRPHVPCLQLQRPRRLPDHPPDVRHHLHGPDRRSEGRVGQGLPHLPPG